MGCDRKRTIGCIVCTLFLVFDEIRLACFFVCLGHVVLDRVYCTVFYESRLARFLLPTLCCACAGLTTRPLSVPFAVADVAVV